jgi:hypothetical protein
MESPASSPRTLADQGQRTIPSDKINLLYCPNLRRNASAFGKRRMVGNQIKMVARFAHGSEFSRRLRTRGGKRIASGARVHQFHI